MVNGEERDASIRPNQIFAVSLHHTMLSREMAAHVVETVERHLLTPFGLRSLSPADPHYRGRYEGDPASRDGAYHQGTVWPWLMGPFLTAYLSVNARSAESREQAGKWLAELAAYIGDRGVGQLPEIFDGDAPHRSGGCIAQAWTVAELLRVCVEDLMSRGRRGSGALIPAIDMRNTAVVIPTYNERDNIATIVGVLLRLYPAIHILVVDDDSPDGTARVVRDMQSRCPNLTLLVRKQNRGFAPSYRDGFRRILAEPSCRAIVTMDADFSHDPAVIEKMLAGLAVFDVVVGSRYTAGGSVRNWNRRALLSRTANYYVRAVLHFGERRYLRIRLYAAESSGTRRRGAYDIGGICLPGGAEIPFGANRQRDRRASHIIRRTAGRPVEDVGR